MKAFAAILLALLPTMSGDDDPGYLDLVPQIVSAAREDALKTSRKGTGHGPLLVEAASFAAGARALDGSPVPERAVLRAIGGNTRSIRQGEGVVCGASSVNPSVRVCEVADNGVIVRLESLTKTTSGVSAVVSTVTTDRRGPGRSATRTRTVRYSFGERGESWYLAGKAVLRQ